MKSTPRKKAPAGLTVSEAQRIHRIFHLLSRQSRRRRVQIFERGVAWLAAAPAGSGPRPLVRAQRARSIPDLATELINWIASRPPTEHEYWLATAYSRILTDMQRRRQAAYFTPPRLIDEILERLENTGIKWSNVTVLDPACGGAAFLAPIAARIAKALKHLGRSDVQICTHIERHVQGIEIDPILCKVSVVSIRRAIATVLGRYPRRLRLRIRQGDALAPTRQRAQRFDLVVANPPFRKISQDEQQRWVGALPFLYQGQQNIYAAFMGIAIEKLAEGGTGALVTPTSFMSGRSFAHLRTHLHKKCHIEHVHLIEPREGVFFDVQQEAAVTYLSTRSSATKRTQAPTVSMQGPDGAYSLGRGIVRSDGSPWLLPRAPEDASLIEAFCEGRHSLESLGYRPLIGAYVWNRDTRRQYSSWARAREGAAPFPVIWSSHISNDLDVRYPVRAARWRGALILEMGRIDAPGVIRSPCVVLQRIASKEEHHRLKACVVPDSLIRRYGGVVGENHVVFLVPLVPDPRVSPERLAQILRTKTMDRLFRCVAGSATVSVLELNTLPFPDPAKLECELARGIDLEKSVRRALGLEADLPGRSLAVNA
jgi:adenine-specific DNA-methyltransferase